MSIINTQDFYEQLENDYKEMSGRDKDISKTRKDNGEGEKIVDADKEVRQSFLYKYFKRKKDADAQRIFRDKKLLFSVRDKYTRFKGAYIALENNLITKEEYRGIFFELNAGVKKREKLFDTDPEAAQDQLEDRLLKDYVDDFFHNAKGKLKKFDKSDPAKDAPVDEIEMLYEFNKLTMPVSFVSTSDLDDDYINKCEDLYDIIRADDAKKRCFVPLYIDKDSGAGVYIIGNQLLDTEETKVCVLEFYDAFEVDEPFFPIEMEYTTYDSVRDAFEEFKKGIEKGSYFDVYSLYNGAELPKGVDECFISRFFDSCSTNKNWRSRIIEADKKLTEEGIRKMKESE